MSPQFDTFTLWLPEEALNLTSIATFHFKQIKAVIGPVQLLRKPCI